MQKRGCKLNDASGRRPVADRQPLVRPQKANQIWSMDIAEGRVIKCLTIGDNGTHEAVAVTPERVIGGHRLTRLLDELAVHRGLPSAIRR